MHGIVLFVTIHFIFGEKFIVKLSIMEYWLFISLCAALLVIICFILYHLVELPGMNATGKILLSIRSKYEKARLKMNGILQGK
jgi:peptidoglycan/LPS O-acetylase OafA/YrhL